MVTTISETLYPAWTVVAASQNVELQSSADPVLPLISVEGGGESAAALFPVTGGHLFCGQQAFVPLPKLSVRKEREGWQK